MEVENTPKLLADYNKKSYIYTLPKSGTYLWGVLLEELGVVNSGYHLSVWKYLDTKAHEDSVNSKTPSQTAIKSIYIKTLHRLKLGHFCFGHLCPMFFPSGVLNQNFKIICSYRRPKEILVSEFIDFRYRRDDVPFVSQTHITDPKLAFEQYLQQHGHVIKEICLQYLLLRTLKANPLYHELMGHNIFFEIHYSDFFEQNSGPQIIQNLLHFLHPEQSPSIDSQALWNKVLSQDNKTKSTGLDLPFDKADLWTAKNEHLYQKLGFDYIETFLMAS